MLAEGFSQSIKAVPGKVPGIYQITNKRTKKIYIGSSLDVRKRLLSHLSELKRNAHGIRNLQRDFNYNGEQAFEVELLEKATNPNQLAKLEQSSINKALSQGTPVYNVYKTAARPGSRTTNHRRNNLVKVPKIKPLQLEILSHLKFAMTEKGITDKDVAQSLLAYRAKRQQLAKKAGLSLLAVGVGGLAVGLGLPALGVSEGLAWGIAAGAMAAECLYVLSLKQKDIWDLGEELATGAHKRLRETRKIK